MKWHNSEKRIQQLEFESIDKANIGRSFGCQLGDNHIQCGGQMDKPR